MPESGPSSDEETLARTGTSPGAGFPQSPSHDPLSPGSVIAGRYRVVRLLGRGGMGEVYLVHDLTLDQDVALKFLPEALSRDATRLALFHNEVRVARRVTHRNVCRIFDIGEAQGRPFLSMEYVDGEDLASLLRRIGRLPEDKGLQVARQLAAGLAVAHEEGIVHRDLKPANVMIDGSGQARITDFGLAAVVDEVRDVRSGTPAYQAPEQLRGEGVSPRSDLYSLGLILYEVFTGRRAFDERTGDRELASVRLPTSAVRELSTQTEAAILKCLAPAPEDRPSSALELSSMLPGSDPLAEALAAGRTPSPELVAAAGQRRAFSAPKAVACAALAMVGLLAFAALRAPGLLLSQVPRLKPPAVLLDRAETLAREARWGDALPHRAYGFRLEETEPPSRKLRFWFRASPVPLDTFGINDRVSRRDPPMTEPGMLSLEVDSEGRLVELVTVPEPGGPGEPPVDWSTWFAAAELDRAGYRPDAPVWTPGLFADERFAWQGERPSERVEAGTFEGKVAYFRVGAVGRPETAPARGSETGVGRTLSLLATAIGFFILVGIPLLARRQWKLGRGDRVGAARIAGTMFAIHFASSVLLLEHYLDPTRELNRILEVLTEATFVAAVFWVFYFALEPFARRIWPHGLISWNRLLSGALDDPLVGRDILIGALAGVAMASTIPMREALASVLGETPSPPGLPGILGLLGARFTLGELLLSVVFAVNNAVLFLFLLVVIRSRVTNPRAAAVLTFLMASVLVGSQVSGTGNWLQTLLVAAFSIGALVRFGFLAFVVAGTFYFALRSTPFTLSWGEWTAGPTVTVLLILSAFVVYGFVRSRAREPLFGRRLVPE